MKKLIKELEEERNRLQEILNRNEDEEDGELIWGDSLIEDINELEEEIENLEEKISNEEKNLCL